MSNMFDPNSGAAKAPELIPTGTLSWATIQVGAPKQSGSTGGTYYPVTLTLMENSYEGRKVFELIPDINDTRNSEKWIAMGKSAITRIFESAGWFNPAKPETYAVFNGKEFLAIMNSIDGLRVAIKVKIEHSKDPAYADKNKVGEWLSPNPNARGGYQDYQRLIGGSGAVQQARSQAFAPAPQAPTMGQGPGWVIKGPASGNAPF